MYLTEVRAAKYLLVISCSLLRPAEFGVNYEGPILIHRTCQEVPISTFYSECTRVLRIGVNTTGRGNRAIQCHFFALQTHLERRGD